MRAENFFPDKSHQVIGKLRIGFNKITAMQKFSRTNQEILRKLQEKDKEIERLQQHILNLEKQKNDEIQQLEIISQNLDKIWNLKRLMRLILKFLNRSRSQNCGILWELVPSL